MENDQQPTNRDAEKNTLIIEDRVLSHGFIQLPKLILHARNLSRDAKLLYAVLLSYAWQAGSCFPGYKRLCDDLQASENMVRKYMRELESAGLLSQRRRGLGKTNIYTLCDLRTSKIAVQEPHETEDKEEAEEQDANLRNSKAEAGKASNPPLTKYTNSETKPRQTTQQPLEPARTTSPNPPRHGQLSSISDILTKRGQAPKAQTQQLSHRNIPDQIAVYISEITEEMGDRAQLRSNLTYAARLKEESNRDPDSFVAALLEARAVTRDRRGNLKSPRRSTELRRPMAYFWKVVRDLLGTPSTPAQTSTTSERSGSTLQGPDVSNAIYPMDPGGKVVLSGFCAV
jgi:hypothetical protein